MSDSHISVREALLTEAERIAKMGSWSWDVATGQVSWSDELFRILGLDRRTAKPSVPLIMSRLHPDDAARMHQAQLEAEQTGDVSQAEMRVVRDDGSERIVVAQGRAVRASDGTLLRIVGTFLDVTESRLATVELATTTKQLMEAQRIANVGSWSWNMRTGAIVWSEQLHRICGVEFSVQPTTELFDSLVHPDDLPRLQAQRSELFATDHIVPAYQLRIVRPSGDVRIVEMHMTRPSADVVMGSLQDITDRIAVEQELSRYREELETLVKQRSSELETLQDELVRKERLAAIGQLLSVVSHELRNPLGTIRNSVYTLRMQMNGPDETRSLERVQRAVSRCDRIIEELLDYSRTTQLSRHVVPVDELVQECAAEFSVASNIELVCDLGASALISVDGDRFRRALLNLVANAEQAMPDGGQLTITTSCEERLVTIEVRDTGHGIAPQDLDRVWDPFFSTKSFGVGLGLAVVFNVVEAHDGAMMLASELGQGTRVSIIVGQVDA